MIQHIDIIKQSKAYKIISQDVSQNRVAHSYMFISENRETLDGFIDCVLQTLYCHTHNACGVCPECVKLEHNNNPNIYKLKKDGAIKVEDIKDLIADTTVSSVQDGFKTYIIYNSENMNEASQNKLLKTIEEPPKNVIIILAVSHESNMLQTIKSRTKKIYLNVWNNQNIAKELAKIGTNCENIELAVKFSKGNFSEAKRLLTDVKFQKQYGNIIDLLTGYTSTALIGKYIKYLGEDKEQILYSLSIIEGIISSTIEDIINNIPNPLASIYSLATLANITDLTVDTAKRLNSNCNAQAVATNFLLKIAEIKYLTSNN